MVYVGPRVLETKKRGRCEGQGKGGRKKKGLKCRAVKRMESEEVRRPVKKGSSLGGGNSRGEKRRCSRNKKRMRGRSE